ncbi:hypothetical protein MRY16398_49270 [Phytobacter sp. MRY16-398]|nr:hypothetical protein MRY16398_49270 [Phytobacter sp. MRY16-398]
MLAFLWGFLTPQGEGTISCGLNVFNLFSHGWLVFPHDNHSDIFVPPWRRACSEGVESPLKSVRRRPDDKVRPPGMAD